MFLNICLLPSPVTNTVARYSSELVAIKEKECVLVDLYFVPLHINRYSCTHIFHVYVNFIQRQQLWN